MGYNKVLTTSMGNICVTIVNPRLIVISPTFTKAEQYSDGELVGLNFSEDLIIQKGETFTLGKQKFKIQKLTKESSLAANGPGYYLHTHKKLTKTSNFILPFLGANRHAFRWVTNFTNAFIGTELYGDYQDSLYVLFRYDTTKAFAEFEENLKGHAWFSSVIDTDPWHVLFKFDFPEEIKPEIELIINGKYSQLSEETKERILEFHLSGKDRPLGQILYKSEARRLALSKELEHNIPIDNELLDPFYSDDEVFMLKYIIDGDPKTSSVI